MGIWFSEARIPHEAKGPEKNRYFPNQLLFPAFPQGNNLQGSSADSEVHGESVLGLSMRNSPISAAV